MPTAEIIAIGTELLLGEIQDTNTCFLARALRDTGIDLYRTMMIGDNPDRIAQVIRESMLRSQIVITTGGLGPTVDDPTREAVALALGVTTEFKPELWEQIQDRFKRFNRVATENNRRQAYIPFGAQAIENPVGTAPAFVCDTGEQVIFSLPGVPREMEYLTEHALIPYLQKRFPLTETIRSFMIHVAGMGESQIDEIIGDLETSANPTVGLAAHAGIIDVRITAKAASRREADQMCANMAEQVKLRIGDSIFGYNEDRIEDVICKLIQLFKIKGAVLESNLSHLLLNRLQNCPINKDCLIILPPNLPVEEIEPLSKYVYQKHNVDFVLAVRMEPGEWQQNMQAFVTTFTGTERLDRSYGGPASMGVEWCINTTLEFLRRTLLKTFKQDK